MVNYVAFTQCINPCISTGVSKHELHPQHRLVLSYLVRELTKKVKFVFPSITKFCQKLGILKTGLNVCTKKNSPVSPT